MTYTLTSLWLCAFGVLALAAYWRISRALDAQAVRTAAIAERAIRAEDSIAALSAAVGRLEASIGAQRGEAAALRAQLTEFIEGPPTMRRPPVGSCSTVLDAVASDHDGPVQQLQGEGDMLDDGAANTFEAMMASLLSLRGLSERRTTAAEPDATRARADEATPPSGHRTIRSFSVPTVETPALILDEMSS